MLILVALMEKTAILAAVLILISSGSCSILRRSVEVPSLDKLTGDVCINEGDDPRELRGVICRLQQLLSYKDENPPELTIEEFVAKVQLVEGRKPPYLALKLWLPDGRIYEARAGCRYDVNWRGFICPSLAFKRTDNPNPY